MEQLTKNPPPVELVEDRVVVRFWADEFALTGPPVVVLELEDVVEKLASSHFMIPWIANQIRGALKSGEVFQNVHRVTERWRGRADGVKSEYRVATRDEVLNYASTGQNASLDGRPVSRRSQELSYTLHYLDSDGVRAAYERLPKQARLMLDLLNESGRTTLTEAAIGLLLSDAVKAQKFRTKQEPIKVFSFYRNQLIEEGHIEELS